MILEIIVRQLESSLIFFVSHIAHVLKFTFLDIRESWHTYTYVTSDAT